MFRVKSSENSGSASTIKSRTSTIARRVAISLSGLIGLAVLVALAGCGLERVSSRGDAERYPPPGQLIDVGGFRMHLYCTGEGDTTVVLDAGLGGSSLDWNLVQPDLEDTARICSYDRAGMGWSESSPEIRTPEQIARELHELLAQAGITPPFVLVGHSLGGKNIRMFALQYPDEVAGMVLVDARSEYVDERASAAEVAAFHDAAHLQGTFYKLARTIGVARFFGGTLLGTPSSMPGGTRRSMALLATSSKAIAASTDEAIERSSSDEKLENAPSLGERPLVVLAAGQSMEGLAFWSESQLAQSALSMNGRLVVVEGSGHSIHWHYPAIVIDTIRDVITAVELRLAAE